MENNKNNKRKLSYTFLFGLLALTVFIAACTNNADTTNTTNDSRLNQTDNDTGIIIRDNDSDNDNRITGDVIRDNTTVNRTNLTNTTNGTTANVTNVSNDTGIILTNSSNRWGASDITGSTAQNATNTTNGTQARSLVATLNNKTTEYTVEYDITANSTVGNRVETIEQQWIQSFNLPNFVTVMIDEENDIETRTIYNNSVVYSCTNVDNEWACIELPDVEMNASNQLEQDVTSGVITSTYLGTCARAGEIGDQYRVVTDGVEYTVCYSADGILLELETEDVTMYATRVRDEADESLFELPAQPQLISGIGTV
jgi:hypothetical protein